MIRTIRHLIATSVIAAALAACTVSAAGPAPAGVPPVDEATATRMARNALEGYNSSDYAVWSRDWSETMRAAIKDADFQAARNGLMATLGRYVSIDGVAYAETQPGVHRYTFQVAFEKQPGTFWIGFVEGSGKIEGVRFE